MVQIREIEWKNQTAVLMENASLRTIILPGLGSKTVSLFYKEKEFELTAPNKQDCYRIPEKNSLFELYDASGLDDTFPNITESVSSFYGKKYDYPDHGEIWKSSFQYHIVGSSLNLVFESKLFPYRYEKTVTLKDNHIIYHYCIKNISDIEFPCIWTMHGLVRYEEDMRLLYPSKTKDIWNVLENSYLGEKKTEHIYGESPYDFSRVPKAGSKSMVKYYIKGKVSEGCCGYEYPAKGVRCRILYDAKILPYLGFWITAGGFRGDYNCAFEPSNGYYDSIDIAKENESLYYLKPDKSLEFDIVLEFAAL